jgi:hypothetical protein
VGKKAMIGKKAFAVALRLNDGDVEGAERLLHWLQRRAEVFVEKLWPDIRKVAFALLEYDRLTGQQVVAILNGL